MAAVNLPSLEEIRAEKERRKKADTKASKLLDLVPPNSEPQRQFIESEADITIYGGSAGGGKTFAELLEPTRHVHNPLFGATIFRRTMKQVKDEGGIWDQSTELYSKVGAVPNMTERFWTFPTGATIQFAGLETESSKYTYQGAQICDILFDELTHFSEGQFFYLLSRNRSTCGIRPQVHATTNPEPGWVKRLLAPWVDSKFSNPAKSGEVRWFVREHNQIVWVPKPPERPKCTKGPNGEGCFLENCESCFPPEKSITFIRASIFDNRDLLKANPEYVGNLKALDTVERKRLLDGDWDVKPPHRVIDNFDEDRHVVPWFEVPKTWLRAVGQDFGGVNGAEVALAQKPGTNKWIVIGECWPGESRGFEAIADDIRRITGRTPDRGCGGNRSTEQGWRQSMRKEGIPMEEPDPKHTDPKLQYQCVNDAFKNDDLEVMDNCPKLIQMLTDFTRKIDPADNLPTDDFEDTKFHLCAALRYIGVKLFPPKAVQKAQAENSSTGTSLPVNRASEKTQIPTVFTNDEGLILNTPQRRRR